MLFLANVRSTEAGTASLTGDANSMSVNGYLLMRKNIPVLDAMIISASRRTDIPAWYTEWLMTRLRAGYCEVINPRNPGQVTRVVLTPDKVEALVFWTRKRRSSAAILPELDARGYRYYFHYTLTGYDHIFEPGVPAIAEAIATIGSWRRMSAHGALSGAMIPSSSPTITPPGISCQRFTELAAALAGTTCRVVTAGGSISRGGSAPRPSGFCRYSATRSAGRIECFRGANARANRHSDAAWPGNTELCGRNQPAAFRHHTWTVHRRHIASPFIRMYGERNERSLPAPCLWGCVCSKDIAPMTLACTAAYIVMPHKALPAPHDYAAHRTDSTALNCRTMVDT